MNVDKIVCEVPRSFYDEIDDIKHPNVNIAFEKSRESFLLSIQSPMNLKLFATSKPFYEDKVLTYFEKEKSHNWSIIVYDSILPFVTQLNQKGMNFPIPRDFTQLPFVGPVDINSLPVTTEASADIEQYIRLENIYNSKDYVEALRLVRELIEHFHNRFFLVIFCAMK